MNITYTLPMKSQYSLKIYELCKSYQNLYITKKEKGEPLVWNIETLKKAGGLQCGQLGPRAPHRA